VKHTRDSRRPDEAAKEKNAVNGANQTQSTAPQSWKEYIDQTMPVQKREAEVKQDAAPRREAKRKADAEPKADAQPGRESRPKLDVSEAKAQAKEAWGRFAQWVGEAGKNARTAAGTGWEKFSSLTAGGRGKLGKGAARIRDVVAKHPVSPLLYATVLAVGIGVMAFKGTYARAYVLEVNGQAVGMVSGEDEANAILDNVESRAASILGDGYSYEAEVSLAPVYAPANALSDAAEVEDTLFSEVGAYMTAYGISVDGVEIGCAADQNELYRMLDEIAQPFIPANAVRYEFVEDVEVYPVEVPSNTQFDVESIRAELSSLKVERAVYTVKQGDTFNAIAYSLDMDPNDLSVLNPDVIVNQLWVDQELVIQQEVPRLSVRVLTSETYEEVIPSPVEYIETADLYVGETKIQQQGEDGLARINAQVTYVNNVELDREILQSETIKDATTTYTYTGTTPRPVTASNGYFIWPVRGTITSNFGGRNLWGSYDFHLGLDIAVPYGTGIKAADGGTVIKAGWSGSYGNLVAIRHDNGIVTYYGHNSSLLVSVGDKVYQGQIIARAGSTGNSSGNHCHFEVRVNNTSVNPRNYLS
jgi:murein DD-endopeptidase MepM/ murein hydrolase activator NlpD